MRKRAASRPPVVRPGLAGGSYRPLSESDVVAVHESALEMLAQTGVSNVWPRYQELFLDAGGWLNDAGRVCLPEALVERCLASAADSVLVHGQDEERSIEFRSEEVHFATGGIGVYVFDTATGAARESTLQDVYDATRLSDTLPNIHCVTRQLIARDLTDIDDLDINTAYALAMGTSKPFGAGVNRAANVSKVAAMMDLVLGAEGAFAKTPICWSGGTFIVSPLRAQDDEQDLLEESVRAGFPIVQIFVPQSGTSGPAALAGNLALAVAEALFVLVWVNLLKPGHPMVVGCWPFVSDLRTGAFSGGGGEQAALMAASAQMMNHYGIPGSVAAGMTDSKSSDFQSGAEKAQTLTAAALAGSSMIYGYPGMLGSIMGLSYGQMVLDDELFGTVLRTVRGIDVDTRRLGVDVVRDAAIDPGHFISHPQTMELMETEFLYPSLGDRSSLNEWLEDRPMSPSDKADQRAADILADHEPGHVSRSAETRVRGQFEIALPERRG